MALDIIDLKLLDSILNVSHFFFNMCKFYKFLKND